jgi:hypothetical protein
MNKPHIHSALIKAWADGAIIEVQHDYSGAWDYVGANPYWHTERTYRIRPEPDFYGYSAVASAELRCLDSVRHNSHNIRYTFDGGTGKLKAVDLI